MRGTHSEPIEIGVKGKGRTDAPRAILPGAILLGPPRRAAELAHDARNLFSALSLYCELLAAPGVLAPGFGHYADDLRLVGAAGARLIEALAAAARPGGRAAKASAAPFPERFPEPSPIGAGSWPVRRRGFPGIDDLAAELEALAAPLRALAGPDVRVEVECAPCAGRLGLNAEDLLRILFNLAANSVEAFAAAPARPRRKPFLRITAQRGGGPEGTVVLSVRDNGPGIAPEALPRIFEPGFSGRPGGGRGGAPRGLGLAIVRQLAEAAGGSARAVSSPGLGARFDIELPVLAAAGPGGGHRAGGLSGGARTARTSRPKNPQLFSPRFEKEA
jgi:signal transduction histidine kinase